MHQESREAREQEEGKWQMFLLASPLFFPSLTASLTRSFVIPNPPLLLTPSITLLFREKRSTYSRDSRNVLAERVHPGPGAGTEGVAAARLMNDHLGDAKEGDRDRGREQLSFTACLSLSLLV